MVMLFVSTKEKVLPSSERSCVCVVLWQETRCVQEAGIRVEHIVPHGSYLVNLAAPDAVVLQRSRARLLDELQRCERLGLTRYNVHPGSTCGQGTPDEGVARAAENINWALAQTRSVCVRMLQLHYTLYSYPAIHNKLT